MLPVLFSFGPIIIPTFGVFMALSFVTVSFLLWRKLKEDYHEEEIISYTILATLLAILGSRILYLLGHFTNFGLHIEKWIFLVRFPGLSLPGAFLGAAIFSVYWSRKKSWDFWVLGDGAVFPGLAALILGSLGAYLSEGSNQTLSQLVLAVCLLALSIFFFRSYRRFIWYKSGQPGFVVCTTTALYFLGFTGLDFWFKRIVYLDQLGGLAIAVLALIFLYRRSGREVRKDLFGITKIVRRVKVKS